MLNFQTHILNDEVCKAIKDKHINKKKEKTYIVSKNRGNLFFTAKFFTFYFSFSNSLKVKKMVSNNKVCYPSVKDGRPDCTYMY